LEEGTVTDMPRRRFFFAALSAIDLKKALLQEEDLANPKRNESLSAILGSSQRGRVVVGYVAHPVLVDAQPVIDDVLL